jgi:hypothetical protein
MLHEIALLVVALLNWLLEFSKAPQKRRLRLIILPVLIIAGFLAIINARNEDSENKALRAQVAELSRKPELALVANGQEIMDKRPVVLTLSGGVYTLIFDIFNRSARSASDVTLTLILPDDLTVLNEAEWRRMLMSTVPSREKPAQTAQLKNHYQRQLGRALFPQSAEGVSQITFVESGEKTVTRSAFAVINSLESGRTAVSFDLDLRE